MLICGHYNQRIYFVKEKYFQRDVGTLELEGDLEKRSLVIIWKVVNHMHLLCN